jgi:hypothetical protein
MDRNGIISQFMRTASLLVVLFAIAVSFPSPGHANMMHSTPVSHHLEHNDLSSDPSQAGHEVHTTGMECGVFHGNSGDTQESDGQCCSSMCVADALLAFGVINFSDEVHAHLALPHAEMFSADRTHLMRPPSL